MYKCIALCQQNMLHVDLFITLLLLYIQVDILLLDITLISKIIPEKIHSACSIPLFVKYHDLEIDLFVSTLLIMTLQIILELNYPV